MATTPAEYKYLTASGLVRSGRGHLIRLIVSWTDDDTPDPLIVYNNTEASGTDFICKLGLDTTDTATQEAWSATFEVGCDFDTGCYITVPSHVAYVTAIYG